jgi:DNA-binding NarL/FixJ family response regulator
MPTVATGDSGEKDLRSGATAMGSIQVSLTDADRAQALCSLLERSTQTPVVRTETPDLETACAAVLDMETFHRLPQPLEHADRIVLITSNDAANLKEAWEAGVHSVLSEQDPLNTVVLAVLATCLRSGTRKPRPAGRPAEP